MDVPKKPFEAIAFLHRDMTKTSFGFTKLALALCALPCEAVRGRARPCELARVTNRRGRRVENRPLTARISSCNCMRELSLSTIDL